MRTPKYHIYLNEAEYSKVIHSLVEMKNDFIKQGRYTDAIDELLLKLSKAKRKKIRVA